MALKWTSMGWLPSDRHEAQELLGRWLALSVTLTVMLLIFWIFYLNLVNDVGTRRFPRSIMLTILTSGPVIGAILGSIPTIISLSISLYYKNERIDRTFYIAFLVIVLSIVGLVCILFQILAPDSVSIQAYFDQCGAHCTEVEKSKPQFISESSKTLGILIGWYALLLGSMLGIKGIITNRINDLKKVFRGV